MPNKVVILGGGVAGLSAAHELVERGYEVEVLEKLTLAGGKARSIPVLEGIGDHGSKDAHADAVRAAATADPLGRRRPWLPGEHGFRFFPNFYRHITDTLARIPTGTGTVADCLVDTTQVLIASYDKPGIELPARFPENALDLANALRAFLWAISPRNEIPYQEVEHFAGCIWRILTSCEERRMTDYEKLRWWDFVGAEDRSEAYQKLLAIGLTRSLVAAKAREASVKTIGDIFVQLILGIIAPGTAPDRLLNGPTNDVWIKPWLAYLTGKGMTYHYGTEVTALNVAGGRISSVNATQDGRPITVSGDWFIGALPIERMAPLVSSSLMALDPSLSTLPILARNVQWMNGIQFYLKRDIPITHGHIIFIDSPWALTAVSQRQFWTGVDFGQWGDGTTRGILSVDISQWNRKGFCGKPASRCTRAEVMTEVWAQLKRSLNVNGQEVLRDDDLHYWFLDPDIVNDPNHPDRLSNVEPLLVNNADTWRLRPEAGTGIPNLALASDYVRTHTDLATMEGANEAARRAVNAILDRSGSAAAKCKIWNLHEPDALAPFREYDRARYKAGQPWDDRYPVVLEAAMALAHGATGIARGGDGPLSLSEPVLEAMSSPGGPLTDPGLAQALSAVGLPSGLFEEFGRNLPGLGESAPGTDAVSAAADALALLGSGSQGVPKPTASGPRRRFRFTQKA